MAHGQAGAEICLDHGPTLSCNHEAPIVAHAVRAEGFDASEDGTGRGTPIVPVPHPIAIQERAVSENPNAGPDGAGIRDDGAAYTLEARTVAQAVAFAPQAGGKQTSLGFSDDGVCQTLGAKQQPAVAFSCKDYGADAADDVAPTMRAMGHGESHANAGGQLAVAFQDRVRGDDGRGYDRPPTASVDVCGMLETVKPYNVALPWAVRRLTPRECERLQGFPDDFTLIPVGNRLAADGPRYKALGNSMAVNVMDWLGQRIAMVEDLK